MTRAEFLAHLFWSGRLCLDRRFLHDPVLLAIITMPPLGYSLYEARPDNTWRIGVEEGATDA